MQNLDDLLSTYYALRQQKATEIPDPIKQRPATELQTLHELEQQFLSAQRDVLEQIRPALETDARSLLSTTQFQQFVRDLLKEVKAQPSNTSFVLKVPLKTDKWMLNTLEHPLQLNQIEVTKRTNSYDSGRQSLTIYCVRMLIQMGEWQKAFNIPTATSQNNNPDMYSSYSAFTQWYEAVVRIREIVKQLPVQRSKQRLGNELSCITAYVSDLFNLYSIVERVGFLHQLQ